MAEPYSVKFDSNIPLMLRDGTITYVDIFRPDADGKFPGLLQRTPYDKSSAGSRTGTIDAIRAASRGYAVAIQDIRGRYSSGGEFYTFVNEIEDGYDSVEWLASQSWCTGKVGMYGVSYVGATQWLAAKAKPPSLAAIAPGVTASNYQEGWAWQGGAFELGFNLSWTIGALTAANWANLSKRLFISGDKINDVIEAKDDLTTGFEHLPMQDMPDLKGELAPYYYDWLAHPEYDNYWKKISIEESHSDITVPSFNFGGWYDVFLGGTIRNFTRMREMGATEDARRGQRLVIGPWVHGGSPASVSGEYNFGTRASALALGLSDQILAYYDYWLKGEDNGVTDEKPVRIFVMGENVWRSEDDWPLSRAVESKYYLRSNGKANTLNGDGSLSPEAPGDEPWDAFLYNPVNPVPTRGGGLCCHEAAYPPGALDQREVESRADVLVYSTPPLEKDTEVTGPVTVTLWAASSAVDTDFTAKLVDLCPCGGAINLTDGISRAKYRESTTKARLIKPDEVYEYKIDLWATSNVFKAGHSIRLEISSSNFPRFDRNPNTGNALGEDTALRPASQMVLHNSRYPSCVTLPVIPS
ncbi:MAG: CocE/NonD family hydrolase [Chloroflexi bacterium]|nr:CocE/NonD family hydrolase [Chloroflexota bacterium]